MCKVSFKKILEAFVSILLFVNAELVLYTMKRLHEPKLAFDSDLVD